MLAVCWLDQTKAPKLFAVPADLITRAGAALGGAVALELAGLPAGAMIGAAIGAGLVASRARVTTPTPRWLRFAAFVVLGWLLGSRVDAESLAAMPGLAGPIGLILAVFSVLAVAMSVALVRLAGWHASTAVLAASPGGVAEMIALGTVSDGANERIAALHLLRLGAILLIVPPIALALD